jgi:putative oxidoreductase
MDTVRTDGWQKARDFGFLLLRIALGIIFMAHGGQKLFGWFGGPGFAATVQSFQTAMGIPPALAILAIVTEFFGGVAVLIGVFTRTAGLGIAFTMLVAAVMVHVKNGFFLASSPGAQNGFEYNLALGAMALFLALAGPGAYALAGDTERAIIERFRANASAPSRERGLA